jgi:molybdate transport system substrate-binding protein
MKQTNAKIVIAGFCVFAALLLAHAPAPAAQPAPLRVLISDGMKPSLEAMIPQIERAIGRRVTPHFDSSKRLQEDALNGEAFDVALLTSDVLDELIKQSKLDAATRVDVARTGIGVGVRTGAPKPDISSPEALKRTLLSAKMIAFNPSGASAVHNHEMLERLGIADEMKSRLLLNPAPGQPQRDVAEGKADLVFTLIPEIKFFPGVELVGPVPKEFQSYIQFAAAMGTGAQQAKAGKTMLHYLSSPAAATTMREKGVEPH